MKRIQAYRRGPERSATLAADNAAVPAQTPLRAPPTARISNHAMLIKPDSPRPGRTAAISSSAQTLVRQCLESPGKPLEAATRTVMEARFGRDLGAVRVHTDSNSAKSAEAINASAYTRGQHVVFGPGGYAPQTITGFRLLAHEVAHTIQQADTPTALTSLKLTDPTDASELEANRAADSDLSENTITLGADRIGLISRQPAAHSVYWLRFDELNGLSMHDLLGRLDILSRDEVHDLRQNTEDAEHLGAGRKRLELALDVVWYKKFQRAVVSEFRNLLPYRMQEVIPFNPDQQSDIISYLGRREASVTPSGPTEYFESPEAKQQYQYELYFRPFEIYLALLKNNFKTLQGLLEQSERQFDFKKYTPEMEEAITNASNAFRPIQGRVNKDITTQIAAAEATLQSVGAKVIDSPSVRASLLKDIARRCDVISLAMWALQSYDAAVNARLAAMELSLGPKTAATFDNSIDIGAAIFTKLLSSEGDVSNTRPAVQEFERLIRTNVNQLSELVALGRIIWMAFEVATVLISTYQMAQSLSGLNLGDLKGLLSIIKGPPGGSMATVAMGVGGNFVVSTGAGAQTIVLGAQQIAELIAAGAIPLAAIAASTGGATSASIPDLESVQGAGFSRRKGVVRLSKGAMVKMGEGGLKQRLVRSFKRVPRNDRGFEAAKKAFLQNLAKEPQVREFFGEGSDELARMEAGEPPSENWQVHHNIPATAEVTGVNVNDPSNFSLLPKWLHDAVSGEWANFVRSVPQGQSAIFDFPIFDSFVH